MEGMESNNTNKGFRNLLVYKRILEFVKLVYELVELLPRSEDYGLKSQMKRATVSILSNFTEGYLRRSNRDKLHFLEIAETSHHEVESDADVCEVLGYWNDKNRANFNSKSNEVGYLMWRYSGKIPKN
jgi:four helix bundle protein